MDNDVRQQAPVDEEQAARPNSRWSVRPWLAALFGFLATFVFLHGALVTPAEHRQQQGVDDAAVLLDVLAARIEERIASYLGALRLLSGEIDDNTDIRELVDSGYFSRRARAIVEEFDAYQAMTALTPEGVIIAVVPLEGNASALGLDVSAVPRAAPALLEARQSGELAMTEPLNLAQGGLGFVGYLPRGDIPGEAGFFSAVFRFDEFIQPLLAARLLDEFSLRVVDGNDVLYTYGNVDPGHPRIERSVAVGQRQWELQISPSPSRYSGGIGLTPEIAWAMTLLAALIMGAVLHRLARGATAELESRAEAWRIAHLDGLTGLPNRYSLMKHLERLLEEGEVFGFLLIDLLQFRLINAVHGQALADEIIQWVGERLGRVAEGHRVYHLGGAEYAVVARAATRQITGALAERLQETVNQHVALGDVELDIDGEVGYVFIDKPLSPAEPLNRAGAALVRAKEHGGPQPYDESIREEAQTQAFLESELRFALDRHQLELHYQPICRFSGDECETVGFEALLRWHHPELGNVRPDVFIPLAESTGVIEEIGRWVLNEACRQIAQWRAAGHEFRVGINLSPRQMLDRGLSKDVENALRETGAPADSLVIEITESLAIRNLESAVQMLSELRAVGVRIALDDFGTGYSSLSYLNLLPIDILKLDRVLISHIDREQQPLEIARGMIALAHAIGLQVVAEGVETEEQAVLLRSLRCDLAQGYLFNRPMPASEVLAATGTG